MLLKRLSEACGGPGKESVVRDLIKQEITEQNLADEIICDAIGNLIVKKDGTKSDGPKVMLAAHMDEVALMISNVEKNGLLKFKPVGGIDLRILVGKSVYVGANKVSGVIGAKPIHMQRPEERNTPLGLNELYIDLGVRSQEEAERLVKVGDYAYFTTSFSEFGDNLYKGKAFDDRVGCAVLMEVLKERYEFPLYVAFTVQEEIGLRGSTVAGYTVEPDLALVIEGTAANDIPDSKEHQQSTNLGKGPALTMMDRSVIPNPRLVSEILKVADEHKIPVQIRRGTQGGTDAGKIQGTKGGVPVAVISVPCRYIHGPVSVMNKNDYNNTIELVKNFLKTLEQRGGVL